MRQEFWKLGPGKMKHEIKTWHQVISGFTQNLGRPSGAEQLYFELREMINAETDVRLSVWKDRWDDVAEFMRRSSVAEPRIYIYAYSWGGGYGFKHLANALRKRGMHIDCAVLCDPVYRSSILPTWLPINPLSMTSWARIKVPDNVRRVKWFYQRQNRPQGHNLIAKDPKKTAIAPGIQLDANHEFMDDRHEWHTAAWKVAHDSTGQIGL